MNLIAMCAVGAPALPPPDAVKDRAAARRRSMLDISYAGSALVGQAGAVTDGLSPGTRFPACHHLRGTRHHLIAFGGRPRSDYLRARWEKLVSFVDTSTAPFDATAAGIPEGGAILVRPDGFVGFRADPADEITAGISGHEQTELPFSLLQTAAVAHGGRRLLVLKGGVGLRLPAKVNVGWCYGGAMNIKAPPKNRPPDGRSRKLALLVQSRPPLAPAAIS
jgi:hypothetical protein